MKKIMMIALVIALSLSSSILVFAEEGEGLTPEAKAEMRTEKEVKRDAKLAEREAKVIERTAKATEREDRLVALFELYNPSALSDFLSVNNAHTLFHEEAYASNKTFRAELQAESASIKSQFELGEIEREDVKAFFEMFKAKLEVFKLKATDINAAKKVEVELNKKEFMTVKEALKVEITNIEINKPAVAILLNELISLSESHLAIDYHYFNLMTQLKDTF